MKPGGPPIQTRKVFFVIKCVSLPPLLRGRALAPTPVLAAALFLLLVLLVLPPLLLLLLLLLLCSKGIRSLETLPPNPE